MVVPCLTARIATCLLLGLCKYQTTLAPRWRRAFSTSPRPINFPREFYVGILMHLWRKFQYHFGEWSNKPLIIMRKRYFRILQGSVFTHAWWSETFYIYCENFMQKLSKSVTICKSCCKLFTTTYLWTTVHSKARGYVAYTYSIFWKIYVRMLTYSILAYVNKNCIRCNYNAVF